VVKIGKLNSKVVEKLRQSFAAHDTNSLFGAWKQLVDDGKAAHALALERLAVKLKMNELCASAMVQSVLTAWYNVVKIGKLNSKVVEKLRQSFAAHDTNSLFGAWKQAVDDGKAAHALALERLAMKLKMNELCASAMVQSVLTAWYNVVKIGKLNSKVVEKLRQSFAAHDTKSLFTAWRQFLDDQKVQEQADQALVQDKRQEQQQQEFFGMLRADLESTRTNALRKAAAVEQWAGQLRTTVQELRAKCDYEEREKNLLFTRAQQLDEDMRKALTECNRLQLEAHQKDGIIEELRFTMDLKFTARGISRASRPARQRSCSPEPDP